jgi:sulfur carrier protein ThiS
MTTSTNPTYLNEASDPCWRRVAYVAMNDQEARHRIVSVLARAGWAVIPQPSGFHLIRAIAGVIDGHQPWLRPGLIVVDARSRGCAGTTIAAGLRELGISIPIVLVAAPGEALPVSPDHSLRIVDDASAEQTVAELATGTTRLGSQDRPVARLANAQLLAEQPRADVLCMPVD